MHQIGTSDQNLQQDTTDSRTILFEEILHEIDQLHALMDIENEAIPLSEPS